jgi:hypothetical protein
LIVIGGVLAQALMRVSLNNQGYNIGIHQTAILMKQANIVAIRPRKRHYYPDAGTRYKKAENLLNREFEQQTLNTHWVEPLFTHLAIF